MGLETDMNLGVGGVVCQFSGSSYLQYGYSTFTVVFLAVTSDILAHVYNNHT